MKKYIKTVKDFKEELAKYSDDDIIVVYGNRWLMTKEIKKTELVYCGRDFIWTNENCPEAEEAKSAGCHSYKAVVINCVSYDENPFYA